MTSEQTSGPSTITAPRSTRVVIGVGAPVLGIALGIVAPPVARWALGLPWVPASDVLRLIDRFAHGWVIWALPPLGLVLGVLAAMHLIHELVRIRIDDSELVVITGDAQQRFSRAQVTKVIMDGSKLAVRGPLDEDLMATKTDLDAAELRSALRDHGWPLDADVLEPSTDGG